MRMIFGETANKLETTKRHFTKKDTNHNDKEETAIASHDNHH